jgi:O-antigen/teichoic acid export membrane protein
MQIGWFLPNAIANVSMPRVAALEAAAARGEISQRATSEASARLVRHTVALQLPTILGLSVLLVVFVPLLFGAKFQPAIGLGFLLIPGVVALSVDKVLSATLIGRGHTIYSLYSALVTTPPTILLYFLLIPRWGAAGGAVASSISYVLSTAVGIVLFHHASVAPLRAAFIPRLGDLRDYQRLITQGLESSWMSAIRSRFRRPFA